MRWRATILYSAARAVNALDRQLLLLPLCGGPAVVAALPQLTHEVFVLVQRPVEQGDLLGADVACHLDADLLDSREAIVAHLHGVRVQHLAFPMYIGSDDAIRTAESLGFKACYWGLVKGRPLNRAGHSPLMISRVSDEFLRRLPGEGRVSFAGLIRERLHRIGLAREWRRRYGD